VKEQTQAEQKNPEATPATELLKPKGILATAQRADSVDRKNYRIKGILVGPSGTGKTQSSLSLPGKKLLIDYDNRWETAVGYPNVEIIKLYDPDPESAKGWLDAEKLKTELWRTARKARKAHEPFPYDAIIEAGLSSMLSYAMNWSLTLNQKKGLGDVPAMHHWMPQMFNVEQHIKSMKQLPCHYILEAHLEYTELEDEGTALYTPKATGKMRTAIPGWFNECYRCFSEKQKGGKIAYFWETTGFGKWDFLKSTLNNLGKYWNDPIQIDFDSQKVGFQRLLDLRFGKEKSDANN